MKPYFKLLSLSFMLISLSEKRTQSAALAQITSKPAPYTLSSDTKRTLAKFQLWISDAQKIDPSLIYREKDKQWSIFEFVPSFPGHVVIEQQAKLDPKTGVATVDASSSSEPLLTGRYIIKDALGRTPEHLSGNYRLSTSAPLAYRKGSATPEGRSNPLLVGGFAVAQMNQVTQTTNPTKFKPVYTLPEDWVVFLAESVAEEQTVIQSTTPAESEIVRYVESPNPFLNLKGFKILLNRGASPDGQNMDLMVKTIAKAHSLRKAVLVAAVISDQLQHLPQSYNSPTSQAATMEEAQQILQNASPEDMQYLLLALNGIGISFTNDPFTHEEIPGLGATLLRLLAPKIKSLPDVPSTKDLKIMIDSFKIGE